MTLSKYLSGIPKANLPKACDAAGLSIYTQHIRLLRDTASLSSPTEITAAIEELKQLIQDAQALRDLNILVGLTKHKVEMVARLDLATTITHLKFQKRHPIDNKQPWQM